ncbi:hypothetical protein HBN54_004509 [Hymenobacter sp. 1B]|uniref:Uncharacterized protein n=1 Tax=Hymenobacter artigasi TaxID=2719616 RepID=A0ABX1HRG5_9BACT|nr:hypothetical protein [Hymenobacter artigasi]
MKDLAAIFATQLQLSADVQVAFDARRRTDPADTVRGRFWLLLGVALVTGQRITVRTSGVAGR